MNAEQTLQRFRRDVYQDFEGACNSMYWINPRAGSGGDDPDDDVLKDPTKAVSLDEEVGLRRFALWSEQKIMATVALEQRNARRPVRIVKLKCRQSGDSTFAAVWNFHHWYWRIRQNALCVAHHDSTTAKLYLMYQTLYDELPPELQYPTKKLNRKELAFEKPHGGSLIAQTAGYLDIGHGLTIAHAHLSEIDRWADPEIALEGLMETIPLAGGTSIIIESVAQGADGWMQSFWAASKAGKSGFVPLFTPWHRVPEFHVPVPEDYEITPEDREWMREFGLRLDQVCWYRAKEANFIARDQWGGARRMKAMYPFTDKEAFQSSGNCVFPDVVLNRHQDHVRPPAIWLRLEPVAGDNGKLEGNFREIPADPIEGNLAIWEEPQEGAFYSHGIDIADGVGRAESVVEIFKWPGYVQVAEWASDRTSVDETAFVARYLGERYGGQNAMLVPEVNKAGPLLLYILQSLPGTYGIFRWRYLDKPGQSYTEQPKLGWETNSTTKRVLAQVANLIFLRGEGIIYSAELLSQMRRCIDILPNIRWRAVGGLSDKIIAAMIAMVGAYLEFEGGSVNLHGPVVPRAGMDLGRPCPKVPRKPEQVCLPHCPCRGRCCWCGWREAGAYDGAEEIFESKPWIRDPSRAEWDFEIR